MNKIITVIIILFLILSLYSTIISSLLAFTNTLNKKVKYIEITNSDDDNKKITISYSKKDKDKLCIKSSTTNKEICLDNNLDMLI